MPTRDTVTVLSDWPPPGTGNDGPAVRYGRGPTRLAYDTAESLVAVVTFPICLQLLCGHPNDEVLQSHPLYGKGLKYYSVHRIANSSRLAALERENSMHPRHDSTSYLENKQHWVFTFQDCTIECLVFAPTGKEPFVTICKSWREAGILLESADEA